MIYIVRHGQTDWNVLKKYSGRQDIELNEIGIKQAETIKEKLSGIKFDEVISSPLKRAIRTAKIISGLDNIDIDERLIERSNGELEGKLKTEVGQDIDFYDPNVGYGIESVVDIRKRVFDFCKELEEKYKDKNVLVVTHAGVSIFIRCYFEGDPKDNNYENYVLKNCEVIKYKN